MPITQAWGSPTRAAVLLFHGLGQTWEAAWKQPSLMRRHYNYQGTPSVTEIDLGEHDAPRAGIAGQLGNYGFRLSDLTVSVDPFNWFDALVGAGHTVGVFTRHSRMFEEGVATCLTAFDDFLMETSDRWPANPPPIILMGHSQGGLFIRRVLKERRGMTGRVQAVVTLCSPHKGSGMARLPQTAAASLLNNLSFGDLDHLRPGVQNWLYQAMRSITDEVWQDAASREMAPGSTLYRNLEDGEQQVPDVRYITVGGTSPTMTSVYVWRYTADSALAIGVGHRDVNAGGRTVPVATARFHWKAKLEELPRTISPMLDALAARAPEAMSGNGDGIVTNDSAKLPGSTHIAVPLNHAEVLWNPALQQNIMNRFRSLPALPTLMLSPTNTILVWGGRLQFNVNPPIPVTWSVGGPGTISANGLYTAPDSMSQDIYARVQATAADGSGRTATARVRLVAASAERRPDRGNMERLAPRPTQPDKPHLQKAVQPRR